MDRGRKHIPEAKRRKKRSLSFSDEEWEFFGELADDQNMSMSAFARHAIFNKKVVPEVDVEAVKELRSIGVNLNQIAKRMNMEGKVVAEEKLRELIKKLAKKRKEIL